ncbi:MAG: TonB-dependent receptor plug domain-containing protein, partial [Bacteroidia bacterium]|nr:TonB-dependent receptor plug domain-containing protein [Bacteroidia bacterium]
MHKYKYTILSIAVLLTYLSSGNNAVLAQSIKVQLDEVQIKGSRKNSYTADLHTVRIDTMLKTKYFGSDLSEILKHETNLNITQYGGQGSLASIRLRGSAPSQTQINWNGIPVNSPTTGSIDLSLLSGGMADAIDIVYGATGSLFGNGTFGGSIDLFNQPDWDNRISVNLAGEAGSWNHYKTGISFRTGNDSWQYHLTGLYQSSANSFRFHNEFKNGNPVEYRMNDSLNLLSFQQHIFFRLPKNWFFQYGSWFHYRDKQLPSSMSSTPVFTAFQKDQSIRQFVRATKWYRKSSIEMVAAYFTDSLQYGEKLSKTDSVLKLSGIRSSDTYLSFYHRWFISNNFSLENGADFEYQLAKVEAYNGLVDESRGAFFSLLKFTVEPFSAKISYRQVFYSMTGPKPLFSAAFQYHLPDMGISLKGQISNKFRFPTLNDRYWQPGGNPDLLPETGLGYDLGFTWEAAGSTKSGIKLSSLLFIQQINNWIQWVPTGTYWSPQNIRQVKCQGIELELTGRWKVGNDCFFAKTMYTYTESLDMSLLAEGTRFRRQLAYVPFHLLKMQAGINLYRFEVTMSYKYTGRRFTT